ncbi:MULTISPECIES: hypothetical protein [Nocardiaceae]|uniref:Uncharacterized protein n=1 Tax=Rhodococcoides corynebacterioides TaxID=53972 RepID=A0ABS2KWJ5_9NOCA|nr:MULTISPECIES: hypothetical protein [Rhodococcus]MBM7416166.1 hypothetical protein [Rhodococcus corynebacterioides]MBP1114419.1 hypothetical protein [Rhodococcus sp. PvP016]
MDDITSSTIDAAVEAMTDVELDRAIRALTLRQRSLLLGGDLDTAWAVTEDLERCLAARFGMPRT